MVGSGASNSIGGEGRMWGDGQMGNELKMRNDGQNMSEICSVPGQEVVVSQMGHWKHPVYLQPIQGDHTMIGSNDGI